MQTYPIKIVFFLKTDSGFVKFMKKYVDIDLFELFPRTFSLILWRLKKSEKTHPAGT